MTNDEPAKTPSRFSGAVRLTEVILTCLLLGSLATNLFLSRKVTYLQSVVFAIKNEGRLVPGTEVPRLEGLDADGEVLAIDYDLNRAPTLVYVFSPECGWCRRNEASFNTLLRAVENDYRVVGISTTPDHVKEYLVSHGYRFPTIAQLPAGTIEKYKLGGTPQTLLISPEAKVIKSWMGAYSQDVKADLEHYFKIELPTIAEPGTH